MKIIIVIVLAISILSISYAEWVGPNQLVVGKTYKLSEESFYYPAGPNEDPGGDFFDGTSASVEGTPAALEGTTASISGTAASVKGTVYESPNGSSKQKKKRRIPQGARLVVQKVVKVGIVWYYADIKIRGRKMGSGWINTIDLGEQRLERVRY